MPVGREPDDVVSNKIYLRNYDGIYFIKMLQQSQ
jgi:hypothetical protein